MHSLTRAIELLQPAGTPWTRQVELERGSVQLPWSRLVNDADRAGAQAVVANAVAIAAAILDEDPGDVEARQLLGSGHFRLGQFGDRETRIGNLTRAAEIFEALAIEAPGDDTRRRNVGLAHKYLGDLYLAEGSYQAALVHHRRAASMDEERLAVDPADRRRPFDVGIDLSKVGSGPLSPQQAAPVADRDDGRGVAIDH